MDYTTIRTHDLPKIPLEPERGADNEYLSRLHLCSLTFVLAQTPEQKVGDLVVYKNRDRILFGQEKIPVTLVLEFNREPLKFDGVTVKRGWLGCIYLHTTRIYPYGTPTQIHWTPEEAVADLIFILLNEEKVRELYQEERDRINAENEW